ncbi:type I-E CRISPR-associated protein Cas7/Cse4/CasC [Roseomonas sp. E05]|uniref:type I-E CRISPR-associated protein Cas7/Cse4/CasC n=1 Tax=Roseomonas sp. E05 TaxID=3046310 RepID=UPI0024B9CE57|nr:type I-E CRISPR-associated protein Cas7/Cse4/CasC [Roseomonas sp. E05]MDJ0390905.1 type I-E CRISPR-associated protein Cas7/Cse4/CasC [Roseomonas sp. E05]
MADNLQIHFLAAYPASCLVRGRDGRPKTMRYGGAVRARVSSASLKRAVRTSDLFLDRFAAGGQLGVRTRRIGEMIVERLCAGEDLDEAKVSAAMAPAVAGFGKLDPEKPGNIRQLAFISPEELHQAVDAVRKAVASGTAIEREILLQPTVRAVDVGLFGRMLADEAETVRMTAAADVAHPFTVGKAEVEADFYVAVDDRGVDAEEVASGFMGDAFFTSGLFYGYARVDMEQLARNLGGDTDLAAQAAAALVEALGTVSPAGKRAGFGSHSRAAWMMVERGASTPVSLATAFLNPITKEDQLAEASKRATQLAEGFDRAYGTKWERRTMDVLGGQGSMADLAALAAAGAA